MTREKCIVASVVRRHLAQFRTSNQGRVVLKTQRTGRPPAEVDLPSRERAMEYLALHKILEQKNVRSAWLEYFEGDSLVKTETLKGTGPDKRVTKLREDLAKLKQHQEHAVGAVNKAEFDEEIEDLEAQITKLEGR